MESRWSDTPHWRPILDRSRGAVETLARDMRAAESRIDESLLPSSDAEPVRSAPTTRKRKKRGKRGSQ